MLGALDRMELTVGTAAVRNGPAELMQKVLRLAAAAPNGQVNLLLGAGELRQAKPLAGISRRGLERLEDHFRLLNLLLERRAT